VKEWEGWRSRVDKSEIRCSRGRESEEKREGERGLRRLVE